jgi:hypothetical protein
LAGEPAAAPFAVGGRRTNASELSDDYRAALVDVAGLPPRSPPQLTGFRGALRATVIGVGGAPGGPLGPKQAYLGAPTATLQELRASFDALMAQGAMASFSEVVRSRRP